MKNRTRIAYAEINEILKFIEKEYVERIPNKVRSFFENERDKEHKITINLNESLLLQGLERETFVLLAILNLNYWCDSEDEKEEFIKELEKNELIKKEEIKIKYNPENLFKNKKELDISTEETSLVQYKEGLIKKIINKLKKLFKRE